MVRRAVQGIKDVDTLIERVREDLNREFQDKKIRFDGDDFGGQIDTLRELAVQLAVRVEGYSLDQRLFAIELESEERTKVRNGVLRAFGSAGDRKRAVEKSKIEDEVFKNLDGDSQANSQLLGRMLREICDPQPSKKPRAPSDLLYKLKPMIEEQAQ